MILMHVADKVGGPYYTIFSTSHVIIQENIYVGQKNIYK